MNRHLLLSVVPAVAFMGSSCEHNWTSYEREAFNPGWLKGSPNLQGTLTWKFATGGPIKSAPVFGEDGTVYFGSCDGKVYAMDELGDKRSRSFQLEVVLVACWSLKTLFTRLARTTIFMHSTVRSEYSNGNLTRGPILTPPVAYRRHLICRCLLQLVVRDGHQCSHCSLGEGEGMEHCLFSGCLGWPW